MGNKILTWEATSNNGAFQKDTEVGIFSDELKTKPDIGVSYDSFRYLEQANMYTVDGMIMPDDIKANCETFIENYVVPVEFLAYQKIAPSYKLLQSTDWIASKYVDEVVIKKTITDEDFKTKYAKQLDERNNARLNINTVQVEYSDKIPSNKGV